jgi:hypothetical protein
MAPANTPKIGIIITLKLEATGGRLRAKKVHAACANPKINTAL